MSTPEELRGGPYEGPLLSDRIRASLRLKTFLCRVSRKGPHLLHVHDRPSYYADILRHQEMGWEMSDTCQLPEEKASDGNPGIKPFQVINLLQEGEPGGDDHHRRLVKHVRDARANHPYEEHSSFPGTCICGMDESNHRDPLVGRWASGRFQTSGPNPGNTPKWATLNVDYGEVEQRLLSLMRGMVPLEIISESNPEWDSELLTGLDDMIKEFQEQDKELDELERREHGESN